MGDTKKEDSLNLERKMSVSDHFTSSREDTRNGQIKEADDAFEEVLGELEHYCLDKSFR